MRSTRWLVLALMLATACGGGGGTTPDGGPGDDGSIGEDGSAADSGSDAGPSDAGCPDDDDDGVCDADDVCPDEDDTLDADSDGVPDGCDVCAAGDDTEDDDDDGTPNACDVCAAGDDSSDSDSDGVPDACDVCEGNDTLDADSDGVPDACDVCATGDDTMDTDGDGVPNACDTCETGDDMEDADGDGVADACDICAAGDDALDADADTVPDACDACPGSDDLADADGDDVPDGCDVCAGNDDMADADGDDVPDGCDICAAGDDALDADDDGVPDACDVCAGNDDGLDADGDDVPDGCDICAAGDDALDADGDGVPDACDRCAGVDDSIDADGDGVPNACDVCNGGEPSILVYATAAPRAANAAARLGCTVTSATAANFVLQVSGGTHDLVIVDAPSTLPSGAWDTTLQTYVRGGGAAILATWTSGWTATAAQTFGVTVGAGHDPLAFTAAAADPVFTSPFDVTGVTFTPTPPDDWGNNGHLLNVADGFSYATFPGGQAIVRGNAGRTFANGFVFDDFDADSDGDGIVDIEALIANQIVAALQSVRNEMYALPYDYWEWNAASAGLLRRAVDFRWNPLPYDRTRRVRVVSQCADTTGPTNDNPSGVSAGEVNATVAALVFAGAPAASISVLADSSAVDAAIGTFDVLVFPEAENCTLDATVWRPIVRRFIHRGGRVVFTGPNSNSGAFANALALFGTGSSVGISEPFTLVADPFWTGITHPPVLNASRGWVWAGAGLEPLARDVGGTTTVFRYVYRAP